MIIGSGMTMGALGELGELYIVNADSYTLELSVDEYTILDGVHSGAIGGEVAVNGALGTITINKIGQYQANVNMSFSLDGKDTKIDGSIFANGIRQDKVHFERDIKTVGVVGAAGAVGFCNIDVVPVVLDFRLIADVELRTVAVQHFNISIVGMR